MALQRALKKYPTVEKINFDKDRAKHPIMGFKVPRLWRPPYLQIALDAPSVEDAKKVIAALPGSDRIILEVGTPLIKRYGTRVINELRQIAKDKFIIADLKTLDVGKVEVDIAYEDTADAVVAAGLAPPETLDATVQEAKRMGVYAVIDMLNVEDVSRQTEVTQRLPRHRHPTPRHRPRKRQNLRIRTHTNNPQSIPQQEIPNRSRRRHRTRNS